MSAFVKVLSSDDHDMSVGPRVRTFDEIEPGATGSSVFVGDAFLVAKRTPSGIGIVRVEPDGKVTCSGTLGSYAAREPQLDFDGKHARATWSEPGASGSTTLFATLDRGGSIIDGPVAVGVAGEFTGAAPIAEIGGGTVALLLAQDGLEAARLDPALGIASTPVVITRQVVLPGYKVAPWGSEAIVAWISGEPEPADGTVRLARIAP